MNQSANGWKYLHKFETFFIIVTPIFNLFKTIPKYETIWQNVVTVFKYIETIIDLVEYNILHKYDHSAKRWIQSAVFYNQFVIFVNAVRNLHIVETIWQLVRTIKKTMKQIYI
jgi:hypothetical protein